MTDDNLNFTFKFDDGSKIVLKGKEILKISSSFYYEHINRNSNNEIVIPSNISCDTFKEYIEIVKEQINNETKGIIKNNVDIIELIQLSEFLETDNFSMFLINEYILYEDIKINKTNAYTLLILSFNKLNKLNVNEKYNNEEDLESIWLDLFLKSLEIVGRNLLYFFLEEKLDIFDKKIIDELFEKFFMNLISLNYLISDKENKINDLEKNNKDKNDSSNNTNIIKKDEEKNDILFEQNKFLNNDDKKENYINLDTLRKMTEYLINRRAQNGFFCLLSNEFMKISSEESLSEINSLPNPTFLLKLDINDIDNYYEEFEIENQINNPEQKILLVINYKKLEDSFNISLKFANIDKQNIKNNKNIINKKFDILTFLTATTIEELDARQNNIKSISINKSKQEIFKINNFSKSLSYVNNNYLTLKIYLKPCYIHSMLCNYLYYDFEKLYNNKGIYTITKNLLSIIILKRIKQECNIDKNMDKIVICLLNWLNNEINIKEDISELIENITWNEVSLPLLFEFIIKCGKNISEKLLENIFVNSLKGRNQNYKGKESFNQYIIKSLFTASHNIDFINLFCENIKLNKFKSYDIINCERITQNDNSQKIIYEQNKAFEQINSIKNANKIDDNESSILENACIKQNKSTSNLHFIKIDNSKKNEIVLNITKYNITNSSKENNRHPKKISNIKIYNNKNSNNKIKHNRNKTLDLKLNNSNKKNNNTVFNKKKDKQIYFETNYNNKFEIINKSLHNNNKTAKMIKKIKIERNQDDKDKKTASKISLITELNKLKLKVKANTNNNPLLQKNKKKLKEKFSYNAK